MTDSIPAKIILTIGHIYCGLVAIIATFFIKIIDKIARLFMSIGQNLTGAKVILPEFHEQRCSVAPVYSVDNKDILDETATKQASNFTIPEDQLIAKAKEIVMKNIGCDQPELLADDFLFIFPIVGPLKKAEFIEIFSSFGLEKAMTGSPNMFNFFVDPLEPNRVWFLSRGQYKHTGDLKFGPQVIKASGKTVVTPPQMLSMSFNDAGQCYKFTGGYVVDKTVGNCDGLGGLFGIMHSLGYTLPFHEGQPWTPSLSWEAYAKHFPSIEKIWKKNKM
eukprot:TRINITY_DN12968_c0_g2_i1.p1 TRINITY_DN12968_c0_g2~~TRINITY_DN12968_c0_g2_i1.p1  ORF type:complete len:276 (+),score=62.19 TRINITY_DN12968_c0_g2_i1:46-873(+)